MKQREAIGQSLFPRRPEVSAPIRTLADNPDLLLARWRKVARQSELEVATIAQDDCGPVLALQRPSLSQISLYLSAGIHGDEPAGSLALLLWAEENPQWLKLAKVVILPCLNPWGSRQNSRLDKAGTDLNRAFTGQRGTPAAVRRFIGRRPVQTAVLLHEDYDAEGIYLYLLGKSRTSATLALAAASRMIPADTRPRIEGRRARQGLISPRAVPSSMEFWPEAIWLHSLGAASTSTFETPSEMDLLFRVRAHVEFLHAIITSINDSTRA